MVNFRVSTSELVPDRTCADSTSAKDWMNYSLLSCCQPFTNSIMEGQEMCLEKTLLEQLCKRGKNIIVQSEFGPRIARIELCVGEKVKLSYQDADEADWLHVSKIVTNDSSVSTAVETYSTDNNNEWDFLDKKQMIKYRSQLLDTVYSVIEEGSYFEYQDPNNLVLVYVAKIIKKMGPLMKVKLGVLECTVNITSPLCHPMGWAYHSKQDVRYVDHPIINCQKTYEEHRNLFVPDFVFTSNELERQNIKAGTLIEVLSPNRDTFYYAHVEKPVDDYFFDVRSGTSNKMGDMHLRLHLKSPFVFPQGFATSFDVPIACAGELGSGNGNGLGSSSFSWKKYAAKYVPGNPVTRENIGLQVQFSGRSSVLKYVEILVPEKGYMTSGLIKKAEKSVLWILRGDEFLNVTPMIYKVNDSNLFKVGTAEKYGIPFVNEPVLMALPELKKGESRFNVRNKFSSTPQSVSGDRNRKHFLPFMYMEGDFIAPRISFNRSCSSGKKMRRKVLNTHKDFFDAGSIQNVCKQIYKLIFRTMRARSDFETLFEHKEDRFVPTIICKFRDEHGTFAVRVMVCETARGLAGFLRSILRMMGACPNLFSLAPVVCCEYNCRETISESEEKEDDPDGKKRIKRLYRKKRCGRRKIISTNLIDEIDQMEEDEEEDEEEVEDEDAGENKNYEKAVEVRKDEETVDVEKKEEQVEAENDVDVIDVEKDEDIVEVDKDEDVVEVDKDEDVIEVEKDVEVIEIDNDEEVIEVDKDEEVIEVEKDEEVVEVEKKTGDEEEFIDVETVDEADEKKKKSPETSDKDDDIQYIETVVRPKRSLDAIDETIPKKRTSGVRRLHGQSDVSSPSPSPRSVTNIAKPVMERHPLDLYVSRNSPTTSSSTLVPTRNEVEKWSSDEVKSYLTGNRNTNNLTADDISKIYEKQINGSALVRLSKAECIELLDNLLGPGLCLFTVVKKLEGTTSQ